MLPCCVCVCVCVCACACACVCVCVCVKAEKDRQVERAYIFDLLLAFSVFLSISVLLERMCLNAKLHYQR